MSEATTSNRSGFNLVKRTSSDETTDARSIALSLAESAAVQIAREISSGALRPGDRLPPERDLALKLGLGRGALREGLRTLESVGLVRAHVGQGRFVNDAGSDAASTALRTYMQLQASGDIMAVRRLLEPAAIRDIPAVHVASIADQAEELLASMRSSQARGALQRAIAYHTQFHLLLARYASTRLLRALLASMIEASSVWQPAMLQDRDAARHWVRRHAEIVAALRSGSITATADRVLDHLQPVFVYPRPHEDGAGHDTSG